MEELNQVKEKLITFLRSKKCLAVFKENLRKSYRRRYETAFNNFFVNYDGNPKLLFWSAFAWSDSSQGHDFWKELSDEWETSYDTLS